MGGDGGTGAKAQTDGALYVQYVNEHLEVWMTVISINDQVPQEKELPQGVSPQQEVELALDEITQATAVVPGGTEIFVKIRVSLDSPRRMKDFELTVTVDGSQLVYITDMNPNEEGLAGLKHQLRRYG